MIIKVLVENTDNDCFKGEHGLCLYVEYNGKNYLIDSGASPLFMENAEKLGVDLNNVDVAILSHAHYDHSGGYEAFFEINDHAKVILQEASKNRQYYKIAGPLKKYIGIPNGILERYSDRFHYVDGSTKIDEGIYAVGHSSEGIIERAMHTHMCVVVDGKTKYDDFKHEQTIVFEQEDGLVCFNSCSHSGVDIAIAEVKKAFPEKKIKAYLGGFHMMGMTGVSSCSYRKEEVVSTAKELLEMTDATFYSGHCTGVIAYEWLSEVLGDKLVAFKSGMEIDI